MAEGQPGIIVHADNIVHSEEIYLCETLIYNDRELKEEAIQVSQDACIDQAVGGDDCKAETKDQTDVVFMAEREYEKEHLSNGSTANSESTNNAECNEELNNDITTTNSTVADSLNSMKASSEDGILLEMEVIPQRKVGRPRKDKNARSPSKAVKVEADIWEIVEPVIDPTSGVRRSGRKRRHKKISYVDLLDDNLDSNSNISEKSEDEWNYAQEVSSLKAIIDPSPPPSPPLLPVTKSTKRKVAVRRQVKKSSKEKSSSKINKNSSKKGNLENRTVEVKEEKSFDEFLCKECDVVFLSKIQFKNHQLICNDVKLTGGKKLSGEVVGKSYKRQCCPICNKEFSKLSGVKRHISINHSNLVHISCSLCAKRIGDITDCYEHFQKEHPNSLVTGKKKLLSKGSLQCPVCGDDVAKLNLMKQHLVNQHANLIHVTCALCQRSVGSMLDYSQHFVKNHSHLTSNQNENGDIVTTNMDVAKEMDLTSRKVDKNFQMNTISSSSLPEDSGLVCLQCNKSIANYKLLVLHMLSHKVEENTNAARQTSNIPSSFDSTTSADFNEQPDSWTSDSDSRRVDEHPFPVYLLPPENLSSVSSVSGVLGPDLLMAVNRSLNLMTDIVAKLSSELVFGKSDAFCSKDDLLRRLNTVLQYSSGITDVGKCLLLVLEECKQLDGNPYIDHDEIFIEVDRDEGHDPILRSGNWDNNENSSILESDDNGGHRDGDDIRCIGENVLSNSETTVGDSIAADSSPRGKSQEGTIIASDSYGSELGDLTSGSTAIQEPHEVQNVGNKGNIMESQSMMQTKSDGSNNNTYSLNSTDVTMEVNPPPNVERRSSLRLKAKATVALSSKTKRGKKKYICKICGKHLTKKSGLNHHMLTHTNFRPFRCEKCSASFKTEDHLKRHILLHEKDDRFKCDFCDFTHRTQKAVQNHSREKHPNADLFSCDICKHKSKTSFDLLIHKKIHAPRKCKHCDFEASHVYDLKIHERKMHASKLCSYCPYTCSSQFQLKRHIRTHFKSEADNIYCCELCGATFNSTRKLNYHVLRHENKKPLSCTQCDYKCSSRASYDAHMLKHAGVKPYKCDLCDAAFYRTTYLKRHKLIHSEEKNHCCRYCGKGFKHPYNCHEHEMIHTGEKKFKCKLCDFSCRRRKFLVQHLEQHKARGSDVDGLSGSEEDTIEDFSSLLKPENLVPINDI